MTIIALVLFVFVLNGCCKPEEFHYTIRPAVRAMVPYTGSSSFEMRHSSGRVARFHAFRVHEAEDAVEDCADCCSREFRQTYAVYFQVDSSDIQANIQVSQTGQAGVYAPTDFEVHLDGAFYFADFTDSVCAAQPALTCLDSLVVGGQVYRDVFEFCNQRNGYVPSETRMYYDPAVGILKFTESDGVGFWELVR
jgi:hypothetical protein